MPQIAETGKKMSYSESLCPGKQANVRAAAAYLRERISAGATDARTKAVYEGLLDVLDPPRRATRLRESRPRRQKTP